jgi:prevent-host-death family protein
MRALKASEFKAKCLAVLDEVNRTGEPVTILKRGRPVARLVPASRATARHPQETLAGTVEILGDIVAPAVSPNAWNANRRARR